MKFSLEDATDFGWGDLKGKAYSSKDDFANASAACFEVGSNGHGRVKSEVSDRVYYVIDGKGRFVIDDKIVPVTATDVVIVPKNTPYDYRADKGVTMKLFLVHTVAFDPDREVKL